MSDTFSEDGDNAVNNTSPNDEDRSDDVAETTENGVAEENGDDADEDDLFGEEDGDDEPAADSKPRRLDDEELDSGDDLERDDRAQREQSGQSQMEVEQQEEQVQQSALPRHAIPEPGDNEVHLLRIPKFLSIDQHAFNHGSFQPPTTDHHGHTTNTFSAYNTALTTIRYRQSPSDPKELQSNARILRWSDGSLTLQLASDSTAQYHIEANSLAPPQRNPVKPTPTSLSGRQAKQATGPAYNIAQDSFTYLTTPVASAGLLRTTNKITTALTVKPSANTADEAVEKLEKSIAMHGRGGINTQGGLIISKDYITEDPELAKRKAEAIERDKLKQQKAREKQQERERERANRAFNRTGAFGGSRSGGLSLDDLEGAASGRAPAKGAGRAKRRQPRRDEYSDEEEPGKRYNREDSYDQEDDFIAASDEEEVVEDDEEEEEEFGEDSRGRQGTPKRSRPEAAEVEDDEDEDGGAASNNRAKRRRVVDDDDEDV